MNAQLREIASWRIVSEIVNRYLWQKKITVRTLIEQYAEDLFDLFGRLK
jgi:hypothetical protein